MIVDLSIAFISQEFSFFFLASRVLILFRQRVVSTKLAIPFSFAPDWFRAGMGARESRLTREMEGEASRDFSGAGDTKRESQAGNPLPPPLPSWP